MPRWRTPGYRRRDETFEETSRMFGDAGKLVHLDIELTTIERKRLLAHA